MEPNQKALNCPFPSILFHSKMPILEADSNGCENWLSKIRNLQNMRYRAAGPPKHLSYSQMFFRTFGSQHMAASSAGHHFHSHEPVKIPSGNITSVSWRQTIQRVACLLSLWKALNGGLNKRRLVHTSRWTHCHTWPALL